MTDSRPTKGAAMRKLQNFIGGEYRDAAEGRTSTLVNPSTGEGFAEAPISGQADVDAAVQAAVRGFGQWREATQSLGGNGWHYWRYVAGPLLMPAFLGALLLLFANSFSAYATAYALINQGGIVVPLQIGNALTSEVGLEQADLAKALALGMVVIVAVVMLLYTLLQRRTARWLS